MPKTIHYAMRGYGEDMEKLLAEHSPLYQVAGMPDIPFLIIHGDKDDVVDKKKHSDLFVAKMREQGMNIEYMEVPGMSHGGSMPLYVYIRAIQFVKSVNERDSDIYPEREV